MKRWEIISTVVGLSLLLAAVPLSLSQDFSVLNSQEAAHRTTKCTVHSTNFVHTSDSAPGYTAVIMHGLSANRKLIEPVARWMAVAHLRAYVIDLPGHGDSDESFSFERAEQCAAEFLATLTTRGEIDPARTVLIGHSTGAGIAIRLTNRFDAAATIAISPAPLTPQPPPFDAATPYTLPNRLPANLLVFIASLDPYPIRRSAKEWIARLGGTRDTDGDFAARRALRLTDVPRANHTSLLVDKDVARETADWLQRALNLERHTPYFRTPPFAFAVALLGLFLTFPAASTLILGRTATAADSTSPLPDSAAPFATPVASSLGRLAGSAYMLWAVASVIIALLLQLWVPLRPVRLFSGDYLASFLLLIGLITIATTFKRASGAPPLPSLQGWGGFSSRSLLASVLLAFAFFLAASWLLSWQLTDVWLNSARWLRFPWLLLPMFIYALAEEFALGPPRSGKADVFRRLGRALTLRLILLTAMTAALLLLNSNQILIPLLAHFMLLFSICQRLGADAIRRRAGGMAAAVFSAILAAWYIAAVFPLL